MTIVGEGLLPVPALLLQPESPVAIGLKLGSFGAAYKSQMEPYLRWRDRYERRPGEEPPIGLIFNAGEGTISRSS